MLCKTRYVTSGEYCAALAHWMVTTACVHEHMLTIQRCKVCVAGAEIGRMLCRHCRDQGIETYVVVASKQPLTELQIRAR